MGERAYEGPMAASAGPREGTLIVVEGGDGAGKTTVTKRLHQALVDRGHNVHLTREPTDTFRGRAVRKALDDPDHDPVSEALLFAADHAAHVADLRERLQEGRIILSDRYSTSWRVYQAITLAEEWPDEAEMSPEAWLTSILAPFELTPDLVLVLDVPVDVALDRVDERSYENAKFEHAHFLEAVREGYLALVEQEGYARIDASGSLEATLEACLSELTDLLEEPA